MGLIEFSLKKPVLVGVAVVFAIAAGIWSLLSIPIQLTPDIELPKVTVRTSWPGASPYEIEQEILIPQEEHLENLPNLMEISSSARTGSGHVTMEFEIGTDIDQLLPRITIELNRVGNYPENVQEPRIILSGEQSSPIMFLQVITLPGNERNVRHYSSFLEDYVQPELEKISGVSETRIYGGRNPELQVRFDPEKLTLHGVPINAIINSLRQENVNISGGDFIQGKRLYTIRTVSPYPTPEDLGKIVVRHTDTGPIYLKDVARVELGYEARGSFNISNSGAAMMMPVYKEPGSNVLDVTERVYKTLGELNQTILHEAGLKLRVVSDPSFYIYSAIDLVLQNIYLGGILAILALYIFLGNLRSSLVVAFSIPTSLIITFVFLKLSGRNINVISLAGLAFAVGMVMDAAIVVMENIDTWRKKGQSRFDSLLKATREVYGAILASTLTTVAVFLPVVFVEDQAGQLFRDIALAIVFAILLSFLVSTTIIPPVYRLIFDRLQLPFTGGEPNKVVLELRSLGGRLSERLLEVVLWLQKDIRRKLGVVLGGTLLALALSWLLWPKMEYLPGGNRNFLMTIMFPPPGYNEEELSGLGRDLIEELRPYFEGEKDGYPRIADVFFVTFGTTTFLGTVAEDPNRVKELIPLVNKMVATLPAIRGFTSQTSLFERGMGAGRSIDLEIYGDDIVDTASVAGDLFLKLREIMPGVQVRPMPSFDLANPEVRIIPNIERAAAAGITTSDLGMIVDIYTDGRKIDEFTLPSGRTLDVMLMSSLERLDSVEDFESRLLLGPNNRRLAIGSVAEVVETVGPNQINHINGERVFSLRVLPPSEIALETALEILEQKIIAPARVDYAHVAGLNFRLSGTADAFTKTRKALEKGFLLAVAITFLLLVILFEDLLSPVVIMAALPIAAAGGLIALWLVNLLLAEQPLDMLTMLGFLMMIGIVVNNPILIISKALTLIRQESWPLEEAVVEAVRSRLRPIFMTTTTSIFGLMPLVVLPGPGSELYRGLGAAVLGGLALSTVVNMLFVPCLFSLFQDAEAALMPKTYRVEQEHRHEAHKLHGPQADEND
ncbi:MAG: efflux RND transporter permease subunit [Deltaproteobacteria bacterium]|nr:efflux RND transporter permease subunit [Deltaproteobacteria bacterium]